MATWEGLDKELDNDEETTFALITTSSRLDSYSDSDNDDEIFLATKLRQQ